MKPTPEELLHRILTPFEDEYEYESHAEFELRLDREMERTLAMTPAEIRADLEAMGYDVAVLEREAREFLDSMGWRPPRRRKHLRLLSVATPVAVIIGIAEVFAPFATQVHEALPMVAAAPTDPPAAVTAAAAPSTQESDGGSDDDSGSR